MAQATVINVQLSRQRTRQLVIHVLISNRVRTASTSEYPPGPMRIANTRHKMVTGARPINTPWDNSPGIASASTPRAAPSSARYITHPAYASLHHSFLRRHVSLSIHRLYPSKTPKTLHKRNAGTPECKVEYRRGDADAGSRCVGDIKLITMIRTPIDLWARRNLEVSTW